MATFTITTPTAQDPRILTAFGRRLNLGRDATGAEVKQQIINFLINAVQEQETATAVSTAVAGVSPITPS
jgi:hypothetical protein